MNPSETLRLVLYGQRMQLIAFSLSLASVATGVDIVENISTVRIELNIEDDS